MITIKLTEKEIEIIRASMNIVNDDYTGYPFTLIKSEKEAYRVAEALRLKVNEYGRK